MIQTKRSAFCRKRCWTLKKSVGQVQNIFTQFALLLHVQAKKWQVKKKSHSHRTFYCVASMASNSADYKKMCTIFFRSSIWENYNNVHNRPSKTWALSCRSQAFHSIYSHRSCPWANQRHFIKELCVNTVQSGLHHWIMFEMQLFSDVLLTLLLLAGLFAKNTIYPSG